MEGGEESEMATIVRRSLGGDEHELNQAADLLPEIVRRIQALQKKMAKIGPREPANLSELKSDTLKFWDKIRHLTNNYGCELLATGSETETGEESKGKSLDIDELLHHAAATVDTQDRIIVGKSDDEILEETVHRLVGAIMSVGDIAPLLEAEKTRKEAEAALSFGFQVELLGQQIDELRRQLRGIVSSFAPDNKDVLRTMNMLTREPYLRGIAKLRWVSEQISMLRRMDPDLDSQVKSLMMKVKSESYLSSIKEVGKEVAGDEERFAAYRQCWERTWGNNYSFGYQTLLSPMQFTHCKPGRAPVDAVAGSTLQIYSIKVSAKGIEWPLKVYGVVTARDSVDRQRNHLFIRSRSYCQILTEKDPNLRLIGPVRAIVSMDTVYIETELKHKGIRKSEDVTLASTFINSPYKGDNLSTSLADNSLCAVELCFEELEQSVQATVVSVAVKTKSGSLPFPYGGKVVCSSMPCNGNEEDFAGLSPRQILLLDSVDGELARDRAGHLDLLRRVVSVELKGKLQFQIQRYLQSDSAEVEVQVLLFTPKKWNISKEVCCLGDGSKVEITVAWSLLPSKMLS